MNENLPINLEEAREAGNITYANEVIAIIAGMATNEVDGVASMVASTSIADLFGRSKPVTRGVKVEVGLEEASVDLMLTVEYGKPIQKVCTEVQESVRRAIESMTGLHVVKVDVHVVGVSFERETQQLQQGYVQATSPAPESKGAKRAAMQPETAPEADEDEIDIDIPEDGDEPELEPEMPEETPSIQEDDPQTDAETEE
ncbi:MAG: Asp23/Gls24 family envelope stress response protein [Oscillospiraceae bacterium]|jgi:uncharacterized alkaline shock family protein YloU|nr:Asp23/Gls24 family envelope stress response protein [Oscillospiraceae bacterium]